MDPIPDMVQTAREDDMEFIKRMAAHSYSTVEEVTAVNGKLLGLKWIDVNGGLEVPQLSLQARRP